MKMEQMSALVTYICPSCGYITMEKPNQHIDCPACNDNIDKWVKIADTWVYKNKR